LGFFLRRSLDDEARRIAANIAKLRSCCGKPASANDDDQNSGTIVQ
jgi:hypothetical protein